MSLLTGAVVVFAMFGVLGLGVLVYSHFFDPTLISDNGPQNLMEEVQDTTIRGVVVSSTDQQVCVTLLDQEDNADNRKSCIEAEKIINLGHSGYGQPSVTPKFRDVYNIEGAFREGVLFKVPPASE